MTHQHERTENWNGMRGYVTLTCFECRYTAKAADNELDERRCPTCRKPLVGCGKNFRTPRKLDDAGWRRAERHIVKPPFSIAAWATEKLSEIWNARR